MSHGVLATDNNHRQHHTKMKASSPAQVDHQMISVSDLCTDARSIPSHASADPAAAAATTTAGKMITTSNRACTLLAKN